MRAALLIGVAVVNAQSPASGVRKVIELLTSLKARVESETAQGAKDAEAYADQCIASITGLEADVKYGGEKAEELAALQENNAAKADQYAVEVATLGPEIGKLQSSLKAATVIRADEHKTFQGEEAELMEAANMLTQAYAVLKRSLSGPSFLQEDRTDSRMTRIVNALSLLISAAGSIDSAAASKVKAFLEAEDSLSLKQPQAVVRAYESKSGGILDAIEELQEKAAQNLSALRSKEMDSKHAFEVLSQDLKNRIQAKEEALSNAKQFKEDAAAAAGAAGAQLQQTSDALDSDKSVLADTKVDCQRNADEWKARKASAEQEVVTLQKAMDILSGKFSLLQLSKGSGYDSRSKASALLRKLGHKLDSFGLLQAAQSVSDDPFGKVREMISDMIMRLERQAQEEASREAKCKMDIETGTRDVKIKSEQMRKYQARLEKANAKFGQLGSEISQLQEEVKQTGIDMRAWTAIRANEKEDNLATIKDAEESIEALNGAIQTLSEFYGAASLLQTGQPKSDTGNTIIAYLQTAQEDYEKIRQETEAAEKAGVADYEKDMQAAKVSLAKKNALIEAKTQERSGLKVMISQIDDDLAASSKAYAAAVEYLKQKKAECANKAMSFEERQGKREEEIKGLQEALEILSSE
jgi:hypothetical protein